ncbi:unnamed protein product, partial [Cylicostephanus goldi]
MTLVKSILSQACFLNRPCLAHPVSPQDEISLSEYGDVECDATYDCPENRCFTKRHRENAESKEEGYIIFENGRMPLLIEKYEVTMNENDTQFGVEYGQHQ